MDFANLTFIKDITTPTLVGKLYRDRFCPDYFLMTESPLPLCISTDIDGTIEEIEDELIIKATDIIDFWTDIKNGVFET